MRFNFLKLTKVYLASLSALLLLASCASMTPDECKTANWVEVGYSDATTGQTATRLQDHRQACADVGVAVQFEQYMQGFERGLPIYCTAESGFKQASAGYGYPTQCDKSKFPGVSVGYASGLDVYRLAQARGELERERQRKRRQADELTDQIQDLRQQIKNGKSNNQAIYEFRRRLNTLEGLARDLRSDVFDLDSQIRDKSIEEDRLTQDFFAKRMLP